MHRINNRKEDLCVFKKELDMYDEMNFNNGRRSQRAFEIELRVREMEKKYALMNGLNRLDASTDLLAGFKKTSRRIASLLSTIFPG
jgi:hypothetical protein